MTLGLTIGIGTWTIGKYMSPNKKEENKTIAMFLENEEGTYTASTDGKFPTDGYVLNVEKSNCRNGGVISQNPNTKKISLTASKTDACTLYFDKVITPTSVQTLAKLGLTSNGAKDSFSSTATTDEGIFEMEDDYGTSYYYRGAVPDNYVKFGQNKSGQDMYWRIIRINGDGSLRIIYDGTGAHANGESNTDRLALTSVAWNTTNYNDAKYVGYMYGGTNGTASTSKEQAQTNETSTNIKIKLETWYKENIVDTGYSTSVSDEIFCNDRSTPGKTATGWSSDTGLGYGQNKTAYGTIARYGWSGTAGYDNPKPQFTCPNKNDAFTESDTTKGNGMLEYPVGLITADEIVAAGSGKYNTANQSYYLYKGSWYWSLSPNSYDSDARVFGVSSGGRLDYNTVHIKGGVAPVINLSAEYVNTLIGTGSTTDPFRA